MTAGGRRSSFRQERSKKIKIKFFFWFSLRKTKQKQIWNLHRCLPVCFSKFIWKISKWFLKFPTALSRSAAAGVRPRAAFVALVFLEVLRGHKTSQSKLGLEGFTLAAGKVWLNAAIVCVFVHARECVCVQGGNRFEWLWCVSFPSWQTACVPEASAVSGAKSESAGSANHWAPHRDGCKWT